MPRKPDPALESSILRSSIRLLDKHGLPAITMRHVARVSGTTTPTLYERFRDRDALLMGMLDRISADLRVRIREARSVKAIGDVFLSYCVEYPNRLDLLHHVWPSTFSNGRRPTYQITTDRLKDLHGYNAHKAQEIASAIMALLIGTAVIMLGAGPRTEYARKCRRTGLRAVEALAKGI